MDKCSARRHLRGACFSIYDAAMQLTAESRAKGEPAILFASRETLAAMTGYSPRTVGLARIRLEKMGWLLGGDWKRHQRRTGACGRFNAAEFDVISHDEWAETHPGQCLDTGYVSTASGESADGTSEHGDAAPPDTVKRHTPDTVNRYSKPYSNSKKKPTNLVCSLRCADGWEFINCEKMGNVGFQGILEEEFKAYKDEGQVCREHGQCSCSRSYFLELVMDRCKNKTVRYPRAILRMKKQLEKLERLAS